jgi:hypothetical protein
MLEVCSHVHILIDMYKPIGLCTEVCVCVRILSQLRFITLPQLNRDSAVGIAVTAYGLNVRGTGVPVPVSSRIFTSPYSLGLGF